MSATVVREPSTPLLPGGDAPVPARRRPRPRALLATGILAALVLLLPLAFLILEAAQDGWGTLHPLLFRSLTATLLWDTVSLMAVVTVLCAVVGTLAAWFVERTDLPGRRIWAALVVVPVGIPDFVTSFGWKSIFPSLGGFWAAALVMTLAVYPLVYLPVAAALRGADPAQEEVARSLGLGRVKTFWRVTVAQVRHAVLGGCVLVALVMLAEYGAFEILGFRTFTTEIYTEFLTGFNAPAACAMSLVLVVLSVFVLTGEGLSRGRGRQARTGGLAARVPRPHRLGRSKPAVLAGFVALVGLALGVPVGAIVYWMLHGGSSTLPSASILSATWHTVFYAAAAGLVATLAALPVAILSVRHPGRASAMLERSTYLVLAMPGLVIALALTYFCERYAAGFLYQSTTMLVAAYAIMFFPLALVAVRASVAQAPPALEEVGRSLGRSRFEVLWRLTLPLVAPGLTAAFCLVFLEVVTELTATLVLIPTGAQTLATQFWAFQSNISYGQAAPYAGLMILIAVIPSYVLGRWFDRLPSRAQAAS
ncbi:MAG TPA: iron ABC transporter permease [Solirubrobacteraceae bacterium]|jgi:iron(III) transport system permease protein|nr:iron ABC transporter permease [Solirubrobacteraceae bacterium]